MSQSASQPTIIPILDTCKLLRELVGASRFELETSCAQGRRATRLRYAPTGRAVILAHLGATRQSLMRFSLRMLQTLRSFARSDRTAFARWLTRFFSISLSSA